MILNRIFYTLARRWLLFMNLAVAVYVGLPMLAPVLLNAGLTGPATLLYRAYSPMCHQLASRSFFLFGEQIAYPRAIAGSSLRPIEDFMPGIPEFAAASADPAQWSSFLLPARAFRGNEQMGYKMALCQRDISIYASMVVGGLIYAVLRRRGPVRPMPFWLFVIVGLGPIALDGFSQLFSQLFIGLGLDTLAQLVPLRESSPLLRSLTGVILGLSIVWLLYPRLDDQFTATADDMGRRLAAGVVADGALPVDN
ncbi:conserved membrane protein of unknown function [Candidatus Promineifilum breve]|uniref:DUF2085 domain-containing protein n=1 Tax=Candidatus Promineifilum breve TaxID=1806508 RepID=A0A160T1S2_9CHLR|nr:DUF2085 domain-containing protein [Candidatus Promineifilum breve]CUS03452.2 conserved membrane protein of unknown function [Candidatus Promineifilum breve]